MVRNDYLIVIFQEIEKLLNKDLFKDALKLATKYAQEKPRLLNNSFLLNILGLINLNLKDWDCAIKNFERAISFDENFRPAYFNLAITQYDLGKLESAYKNLTKVLAIDKDNKRAKENIIKILNHIDLKEKNDPFSKANHELQKIDFSFDVYKKINNSALRNLLSKSREITSKFLTNFNFREHQLFIHKRGDLNCERHVKIFKKYKTISKNCFSCFKIVIHIFDVNDLIKLSIIFNKFIILENFEMKCRINFNEKNFRGYVYCNNINDLNTVSAALKKILDVNFENNYKLEKRRGCSEFSETFKEFKNIDPNPERMFKYPKHWYENERLVDKQIYKNNFPKIRNVQKPLQGMTLNYFLIVDNWINYSKNI